MKGVGVRLDSSQTGPAAWTLDGSAPTLLLRCDSRDRAVCLLEQDRVVERWSDPLAALAWLEGHARSAGPGVRWVGYLSYELGRLFENLPSTARDDLRLPLFEFALVTETGSRAEPVGPIDDPPSQPIEPPRSTFTREQYLAAVAAAIDYIRAGDIFQVNLSQRFTCEQRESPETIYRRLRQATPARYGALLEFPDHGLICNSPELFFRVTADPSTGGRRIITRPIKGTRPRRPGMERELHDSAKDQAELNMIVDLERNDLGRVCRIGSVRVPEPRVIETHPTVYHGAATVEGILRDDVSFPDLLRAVFPGGSVTGAPKIRAMQIIEELEPVQRGPYCGAIGYLAGDGTIEFNIAIRTMIVKDGRVHVPVGGGIVADSDPAAEYEETLVKAQALFAALGLSSPQQRGTIRS